MTAFDMTDTIAPRSDQMNAEDLLAGPRTFTVAEVRKGASPEQPVSVYLAEFPRERPFKPSKTVRRIMVAAWGADAANYVGKRLTLYRDPAVKFGGQDVGGIRVSHMSGIDKPLKIALTVTRGKRAPYIVKPLADDAPTSPPVSDTVVSQLAELRAEWRTANAARRKVIEAEVQRLEAADDSSDDNEPTAEQLAEWNDEANAAAVDADLFGGEA